MLSTEIPEIVDFTPFKQTCLVKFSEIMIAYEETLNYSLFNV